nr:uncharacterized protein LOC109784699 isoform X2 [Aegilops tauschii subsp. strangulata]
MLISRDAILQRKFDSPSLSWMAMVNYVRIGNQVCTGFGSFWCWSMQSTMDTAGRKPRTGSLSLPARMSKLRAANVHKASRVTAYTAAKHRQTWNNGGSTELFELLNSDYLQEAV